MQNTELATREADSAPVNTGLAIFDSGQFEQLYRVAEALAKTPLLPESLKGKTHDETAANCLLVTEQSHRWGMSPFAVAQCASVINGRLMWEGKLVHAVIQSLAGINLRYDISGSGESMKVIVSGTLPGEDEPRTVEGTVKQWKTTGKGSPWSDPANYPRQLRYRGAREWSRAHNPAVMLGIVTDDEEIQRPGMRNVTPQFGGELREDHAPTPDAKDSGKTTPPPAENPAPKAVQKPATAEAKPDGAVKAWVNSYQTKEGTAKSGKAWKLHIVNLTIDGKEVEAKTFSDTVGTNADWLTEQPAWVTLKDTPKGPELAAISAYEETAQEGELV